MKKPVTFQKILVPTDFSETGMLAIEHAAFLARLTKAELFLLHVIPSANYSFDIIGTAPDMHYHEKINAKVDEKLAEVAERIRKDHGVGVKSIRATGQIARETLDVIKSEKIDLVVMGTHGAKGFEELFIGSNAHKLISVAPCPVLTVQEHSKKLGFTDIVLPIDRSMHSREKVEYALVLGEKYAAQIHILGLNDSNDPEDSPKLQLALDQVQKAVEQRGLTFTRETIEAKNIGVETLRYAKRINADLIVTMTDHESELTGIFLGAFAKQIVNHSRIPVLSIKPHVIYAGLDMGGSSSVY
ncbi:MAG: UspA domain-containing protein [Bacteroidetes bacterium]|nr:MAG: UspA domain-containing protein [Bacteroidota bacterium]